MERHFERDLEELKQRLLWMGSLVERAVHQAVHAVLDADEQLAESAALASRRLAARSEYYGAYEKCAALLVREFGSYKVTNGQFIFRIQPTADSYNAASTAMAAAKKKLADLEDERSALKQSQLRRWKEFVGG